ncbi:Probable licABCH operon regulator [Anaerococcus prevotii]|uniref:PTS modulated transcriptional regulator, MtlR family n=1 Tax=Anaerococcus prevotii (strain ATCC 9321 / DSM 20548 / JCM 6508 / NCTC 11806 / PC1) TaxID=525919 RepID=C7REJ5_ANAPD|nr:PRD domain-containing protein [Anaerococcus prevotii]ACV29608.1 PTS modulated transcriptional regulator, MtlR family [Anaerococcus prevotii DSM 20548]SUU95282.1 Probable licABCH operon regulator [Anaerococcus prevotii]
MIETRTKEIFDYLTSDYGFHSSEEIGEELELSSKTVQKEIGILNSFIKDKGAIVESESGKGYQFRILDEDKFKNFLKHDWFKYAYFHQENPNKDFRIESIMKLFLFSNSFIKQQELADMFYVSLSQINKDIKKVRKLLKAYNIELISKPYYGMKIKGREKDIRLAIRNEIGEDPAIFARDSDEELFTRIQAIIADIDFPESFYMPYANFKNLVVHIYISILRIKEGKYIDLSDELSKRVISYDEFNIANKVVKELSKKLDLTFPEDEILYLTMHLISKNAVTNYEKVSPEISELAQKMIDEIYKVSKYDFRSNIDLFFALALHLGPLIERLRYGLTMKNPILNDIKDNQIAFMLATVATNPINETYKTRVCDDEIGYIALHIASAMENNTYLKRTILVVCGSGNSSAQIMKTQIERKYKEQIDSLTLTDLSKVDLYNLDKFDFIVSSVPIKQKTDTPIVYVDVIFKQKDFMKINDIFNVDNFTEINRIFDNSILRRDIDIKDMDAALDILSDIVSAKTGIDKGNIKEQYLKREEMAFTSYGNVALPHILDQVKGESFSIVLIPKNKVKWNDDRVKVIYSLIIGNIRGDLSLYYDKLGDYLNSEDLIEKSSEAKNIGEFKKIFWEG